MSFPHCFGRQASHHNQSLLLGSPFQEFFQTYYMLLCMFCTVKASRVSCEHSPSSQDIGVVCHVKKALRCCLRMTGLDKLQKVVEWLPTPIVCVEADSQWHQPLQPEIEICFLFWSTSKLVMQFLQRFDSFDMLFRLVQWETQRQHMLWILWILQMQFSIDLTCRF